MQKKEKQKLNLFVNYISGRAHNSSVSLFRVNSMASEGLHLFVESGKSEALDELCHIEGGVYDEFTTPPIDAGEGETEAKLFVYYLRSCPQLLCFFIPCQQYGIRGFTFIC